MRHSKPLVAAKKQRSVQQPLPTMYDEDSDVFEGVHSDGAMEKDDIELELEKYVFGDDAGFHEDIKLHQGDALSRIAFEMEDEQDAKQSSAEDEALQGVDDADVRSVTNWHVSRGKRLIEVLALLP